MARPALVFKTLSKIHLRQSQVGIAAGMIDQGVSRFLQQVVEEIGQHDTDRENQRVGIALFGRTRS